MNRKHIYIALGLIALLIKLYFEFRIELIPGINGGYYPVQTRSILENGTLALVDMPVVFYLNALIIKLISWFSTGYDMNHQILVTSKVLGSIFIPLILVPLYFISKQIIHNSRSRFYEYVIIALSVFSFAPLVLGADYMKNALGLLVLSSFIYFFMLYMKTRQLKHLILAVVLLFITFIHFGTFTVSLLFFTLGLLITFRRKAIIPVIVVVIVSILCIALMDSSRAVRIFFWWKKLGVPYSLANYPQEILNLIFTWLIVAIGGHTLKLHYKEIPAISRKQMLLLLGFIAILGFPFYEFGVRLRFGLMLFIPQTIILLFIYPYVNKLLKTSIPVVVLILIGMSLALNLSQPKQAAISQEAYADLENLASKIENPSNTIIFARHGFEWWVAWDLKTKIANSHLKVDEEIIAKYENVLFLSQKTGVNDLYPGKSKVFLDPIIPENSELVYSSEYYNLYKYVP